jgi:hypothetical protein
VIDGKVSLAGGARRLRRRAEGGIRRRAFGIDAKATADLRETLKAARTVPAHDRPRRRF